MGCRGECTHIMRASRTEFVKHNTGQGAESGRSMPFSIKQCPAQQHSCSSHVDGEVESTSLHCRYKKTSQSDVANQAPHIRNPALPLLSMRAQAFLSLSYIALCSAYCCLKHHLRGKYPKLLTYTLIAGHYGPTRKYATATVCKSRHTQV